jgi:hypothetical protein
MNWRQQSYALPHPQSKGGRFYRKFWTKELIAYFRSPPKIPKYYSVAFEDDL